MKQSIVHIKLFHFNLVIYFDKAIDEMFLFKLFLIVLFPTKLQSTIMCQRCDSKKVTSIDGLKRIVHMHIVSHKQIQLR